MSGAAYGQACENDGDCTAVFLGDVCATCTCANGGILTKSLTQYTADVERLKLQCGGSSDGGGCRTCTPLRGLCLTGTCATRPE